MDVGYVGNQGKHLLGRQPFNEVPFGAAWLPQNQDPTKCPNLATCNLNGDNATLADFMRPYIGVGGRGEVVAQSGLGSGGFIATYGDISNYNALQISVNRRLARDLMFGFNYTWSKVMGNNTEFQTFTGHPTDHRADYALLGFDRTQTLSFNYIYNFPSLSRRYSSMNNIFTRFLLDNWQISGITTMSSGAPDDHCLHRPGRGRHTAEPAHHRFGNVGTAAGPDRGYELKSRRPHAGSLDRHLRDPPRSQGKHRGSIPASARCGSPE